MNPTLSFGRHYPIKSPTTLFGRLVGINFEIENDYRELSFDQTIIDIFWEDGKQWSCCSLEFLLYHGVKFLAIRENGQTTFLDLAKILQAEIDADRWMA